MTCRLTLYGVASKNWPRWILFVATVVTGIGRLALFTSTSLCILACYGYEGHLLCHTRQECRRKPSLLI